jgi:hypothetical protein
MALMLHALWENRMLLAVPACAALGGYMLGRLLRGRGRMRNSRKLDTRFA